MRKIDPYEAFRDHRGEIRDLLRDETFEGATLIFTKAGNVRGNHYHARTAQFTYVLTGSLLVVTQEPGGDRIEGVLYAGEIMVSPAMESHAWKARTDSEVLVFTSGPRSGTHYESDTFRLDIPLL